MRFPAASLLALFFAGFLGSQSPAYDVLILGGRLIDGSGNSWFRGDIAIQGDTIVQMGVLREASGKLVIRAAGLVVAPGFIDIHSHARRGILQTPGAENQLRQGVTTVIEGNDGSSPLPLAAFFRGVQEKGAAINFGMFAGQGSVREQVMGTENRKATPEEIGRMREIVRQAMREGAMGLSTGLFYVPGNFTPVKEVIELAKVAGEMGGMHISHMRDEAQGIADSVRETIRIGEEGGLPTQVTHHKIIGTGNWGRSVETLRLVEEARARGVDVTIDQYPYTASSTGTAAMFPQWSLSGGQKALLERLNASDTRQRIKTVIEERIKSDRGGGDPKNVVMASCAHDPSLAGKSLAEITRERGLEPTLENAAETAIAIQEKGGCSAIYHAINEQDVVRIMRYPFTMIASDGGIPMPGEGVPHPRNYGTFARVLGRYVREQKALTLEDAIRKMTSLPANRLRLSDRGLLRPGMKADICIFDPTTVADQATFLKPHQYATGFRDVLVNGKPVLLEGKVTSERPGRVLYGPAYAP
ncbi:MAG: D-aminoacylase [Acidobacteria bacterium]|nr:D-aminoacylase [Acidobacteriota bacterium]